MDTASTAPPSASPSKRQVFFTRLFSTVILWGLLAAAFKAGQDWVFVFLTALFGIGSAVEYFRLMRADSGAGVHRALGLFICVVYWIAASRHVIVHHAAHPMWMDFAAMIAALQGAFVFSYRSGLEGMVTLQRIFSTVFGVLYTAVMFGFVLRVICFGGGSATNGGVFLVLFLVLVTKFGDAGAYAIGVLFGKHKMIPWISPAKSWEGLFGAYLGCFVTSSVMLWLCGSHLSPLTWTSGLLIAPVLCTIGVIGDLAESVLKRCFVIKDSGHSLPGIGGILDLTDSLLFTAPVLYFYLEAIA